MKYQPWNGKNIYVDNTFAASSYSEIFIVCRLLMPLWPQPKIWHILCYFTNQLNRWSILVCGVKHYCSQYFDHPYSRSLMGKYVLIVYTHLKVHKYACTQTHTLKRCWFNRITFCCTFCSSFVLAAEQTKRWVYGKMAQNAV